MEVRMKSWLFKRFLVVATLVLFPLVLFAQDVAVVAPTPQEWEAFLISLGGLKGASSLAIAAALVQGLMLAFRTKLGEKSGQYRMVIMLLLTFVASILAQQIGGITDWKLILANTAVLAAGQNFLHQMWKQFIEKTA